MKVTFAAASLPATGAVVVGVLEGEKMTPAATSINKASGGVLERSMGAAKKFKGKRGQLMTILAPQGTKLSRVVLYGLGKPSELDDLKVQAVGGGIYAALAGVGEAAAAVVLDGLTGCKLSAAEVAANLGYGAQLRSYRFDKYLTKEKKDDKPALKKVAVHTTDAKAARAAFGPLSKVADGVFLTRDLVSEPANVLYPESFAARAKELKALGVQVQVLSEKQMEKLGMGALLGVGQGSARDSYMVVMRWNGAKAKTDKPIAFVGKGVCFDSGGISIKPSGGMEDMKWDKIGRAHV